MDEKSEVLQKKRDLQRELFAALERLKNGEPLNVELRQKAQNRALRINIASVAKEAGCSRTLIGYKGCVFPEVRMAILDEISKQRDPDSKGDLILNLKNEISELKDQLDMRDDAYAELVLRTRAFERGLLPSGRPVQPASATDMKASLIIVGSNK